MLAGLGALGVVAPVQAGAATATSPVAHPAAAVPAAGALTITSLTPSVVTDTTTPVTITGTITAGATPLTSPTLDVVRGSTRATTRDSVTAWATDTTPASGSTWAETTAPTVPAGASRAFTLTIPAGTIRDSAPYAALPAAVELSTAAGTVSVHTFVGWWRAKEYEPLEVAVVAPVTLTGDPALYGDGTGRAQAWRAQLGRGSRIARMLAGTDVPGVPVTWAVDPAVLGSGTTSGSSGSGTGSVSGSGGTPSSSPTTTPSTGTPTSPGSPTTGPGTTSGSTSTSATTAEQVAAEQVAAEQQRLATRLADGASRHAIWALPYADPDLASTLAAAPADTTVAAEIARAASLSSRLGASPAVTAAVSTGVAWPDDGALPPARETALQAAYGAGLRGALVSGSTLPSTSGYSATAPHESPAGVPVLGWDDGLSQLAGRTSTTAQGLLATQELVAQTATLLAQSPGISRSFVIALPRTTNPDPAALRSMLTTLGSLPWVHVTTADTLLTQARGEKPLASMATSTWAVGAPTATASLLAQIRTVRPTLDTVAALVPGRETERQLWQDALDQLTSVRWRDNPSGATSLAHGAATWATRTTSGIHVVAQDTNFLADEGILQVTVVNDLPDAVEGLRVRLNPTNPRMRVMAQPSPVSIAARSRATVRVRVQAVAAGLVPVTVTLTTPEGTPVGVSADLQVRANPPGRTFYLVAGALVALVLVVGLARTLRGRRRTAPSP